MNIEHQRKHHYGFLLIGLIIIVSSFMLFLKGEPELFKTVDEIAIGFALLFLFIAFVD